MDKVRSNPITSYFKSSFEEIRKITWPTRAQALKLTILVLIISTFVTLLITTLDYIFTEGYQVLLDARGTDAPAEFDFNTLNDDSMDLNSLEIPAGEIGDLEALEAALGETLSEPTSVLELPTE